MGWGVTLSLIGWCAIFISPIYALALLSLSLFAAIVVDLRLIDALGYASWYKSLRLILSFGAITALFFVLLYLSLIAPPHRS